jgi:hypothetical protein
MIATKEIDINQKVQTQDLKNFKVIRGNRITNEEAVVSTAVYLGFNPKLSNFLIDQIFGLVMKVRIFRY